MSYTTPAATRKPPSEIIPLSTGTCPADWRAWAQMFLKATPWTYERRSSKQEWEQKALRQGHIAVNSILRDWIKGQVTAVECGILSFEAVFMPHMITNDGRP